MTLDIKRYALDSVFGMLMACPEGCFEKGRMEILEDQSEKGPYDNVKMKCTNCNGEFKMGRSPVFLSIEVDLYD